MSETAGPRVGVLSRIWRRWTVIAHRIGEVQARLLLSVFYFVIVAPFALGLRLLSDPLRLGRAVPPRWLPRPRSEHEPLARARRQS